MAILSSLQPKYLSRYKDFAALLVKHGGRDLLDRLGLAEYFSDKDYDAGQKANAEELACDLERLGPTFVKFGQTLSTQVDLLPDTYLQALTRLQDDVEPFDFATVEQIIREDLGIELDQAFRFFEREPVAAASLGQVHKAELLDGREVVVKVQRLNVEKSMADDLGALDQIASFMDEHTEMGRRYRFSKIIQQLRTSLTRELDYVREANSLKTFQNVLEDFDRLFVPQPFMELTSTRVLTMEQVPGVAISEIDRDMGEVGKQLLDQLFHAYLKQILVTGTFHADPHPGNLLLMPDDRLGVLDLGMTGFVDPTMREDLLQLLLAVSEGRSAEAAEIAIQLGTRRETFDPSGFKRDLALALSEHHEGSFKQLQVGKLVAAVCRCGGEHGLEIPQTITLLGKMLLNLDQVAVTLSCDFDANAAIRDHAGEMAIKRLMGGLSPSRFLGNLLAVKSLAEDLPVRVNRVMDLLADNDFAMRIDAVDENRLISGLEKIANRIGVGLIIAALIIGGSIMMVGGAGNDYLWGYPIIAIVTFMLAALGGVGFIIRVVITDFLDWRGRRKKD
jgi:predicted unusual protein kinase regulating ubiquinone biosynthesis (AarF/ABC1/UbiB family)